MILPWTSSVNQNTITAAPGASYTRKQVMVNHVWNLYSSLTSSGWTPVSSSYHNGTSYQLGSSWNSRGTASIVFPESMCDGASELDIITGSTNAYTPSEHSWVTLKTPSGDGDYYYITLDCRYPLPPHKSNTGVIIKRNETLTPSQYEILSDRSQYNDLFIGMSAVYKNTNIQNYSANDIDGNPGYDPAGTVEA